jgi:hypothetical protein
LVAAGAGAGAAANVLGSDQCATATAANCSRAAHHPAALLLLLPSMANRYHAAAVVVLAVAKDNAAGGALQARSLQPTTANNKEKLKYCNSSIRKITTRQPAHLLKAPQPTTHAAPAAFHSAQLRCMAQLSSGTWLTNSPSVTRLQWYPPTCSIRSAVESGEQPMLLLSPTEPLE